MVKKLIFPVLILLGYSMLSAQFLVGENIKIDKLIINNNLIGATTTGNTQFHGIYFYKEWDADYFKYLTAALIAAQTAGSEITVYLKAEGMPLCNLTKMTCAHPNEPWIKAIDHIAIESN